MIGLISQNKTVTFQDQHGVTDYDIDGLSSEEGGSFYYHHQILEFSWKTKSLRFYDVKNALTMVSLTFEKLAPFMMTFSQLFVNC